MSVSCNDPAALFVAAADPIAVVLFGCTAEGDMVQILVRCQFQFPAMEKDRVTDIQTDCELLFLFHEMHQIPEQHDFLFSFRYLR